MALSKSNLPTMALWGGVEIAKLTY